MITIYIQELDEHVLVQRVPSQVVVGRAVVAILHHAKLAFLACGQAASQLIDLKRLIIRCSLKFSTIQTLT